MKREEVKAIFKDATDEQLNSIMNLNGSDVEKVKAKVTALETEIEEKKEAFNKLNEELTALKDAGATAEEWKSKYEAIVAENEEKEKKAEEERLLAEKNENISKRFDAVIGNKKFNHEAIKLDYLKKFGDAIELDENKSKSDADIFHELSKDDAHAFAGVTVVKLAGGNQSGNLDAPKEIPKIF